jgi:cAMP phosphodiesterase
MRVYRFVRIVHQSQQRVNFRNAHIDLLIGGVISAPRVPNLVAELPASIETLKNHFSNCLCGMPGA